MTAPLEARRIARTVEIVAVPEHHVPRAPERRQAEADFRQAGFPAAAINPETTSRAIG